eukprot:Anaeramoba_ignava/c13895_g1_i1.p1 GENE.c13895_g1_i1~~c13895_g1_i1.p1  ORF type:complete len:253 (-),score=85.73 c13895_g1_i1:22-780(-)
MELSLNDLFFNSSQTSNTNQENQDNQENQVIEQISLPEFEKKTLLNRVKGNGLEIQYRISRKKSTFQFHTIVDLFFTNHTKQSLEDIKMSSDSENVIPFSSIKMIDSKQTYETSCNINFMVKTESVNLTIESQLGNFAVKLTPSLGEILDPQLIKESEFDSICSQLTGMNQTTSDLEDSNKTLDEIKTLILNAVNISLINSSESILKFYGITNEPNSKQIFVQIQNNKLNIYSDNMYLIHILLKDIKMAIQN